MRRAKLIKIITTLLMVTSILTLTPIAAHAEWKSDNAGWWYTDGSLWYTGWKQIDGKWYYFGQNGYMVHDSTINGYKLGSDGVWIQNINNTTDKKDRNSDSSTYDINISLKYKIEVDDKLKAIDKGIIEATKQAIADEGYYDACKESNYRYSSDEFMLIYDVKEISKSKWKVYFYPNPSDDKYGNRLLSECAEIIKQENGTYKGHVEIIDN